MKNVYVMLPLVEAPDADSVNRKELYPEVGRYIVHLPNDDVLVTEVYGMPEGQEYVNYGTICLGQPRLVPEEELVLAGEVETVRSTTGRLVQRRSVSIWYASPTRVSSRKRAARLWAMIL